MLNALAFGRLHRLFSSVKFHTLLTVDLEVRRSLLSRAVALLKFALIKVIKELIRVCLWAKRFLCRYHWNKRLWSPVINKVHLQVLVVLVLESPFSHDRHLVTHWDPPNNEGERREVNYYKSKQLSTECKAKITHFYFSNWISFIIENQINKFDTQSLQFSEKALRRSPSQSVKINTGEWKDQKADYRNDPCSNVAVCKHLKALLDWLERGLNLAVRYERVFICACLYTLVIGQNIGLDLVEIFQIPHQLDKRTDVHCEHHEVYQEHHKDLD